MPGRVRRPADREALLKELTDSKLPFSSMAAAMVYAAALGYSKGRRSTFAKSAEEIPWEVFVNAGAEPFIDMLAAVASEDKDILAGDRDEDRVLIFEEYASGGLEIIAERLDADHRAPLDTLVDLALEAERRDEGDGEIDLEAIAADLSS
jgi:dnd system-associated protein 4